MPRTKQMVSKTAKNPVALMALKMMMAEDKKRQTKRVPSASHHQTQQAHDISDIFGSDDSDDSSQQTPSSAEHPRTGGKSVFSAKTLFAKDAARRRALMDATMAQAEAEEQLEEVEAEEQEQLEGEVEEQLEAQAEELDEMPVLIAAVPATMAVATAVPVARVTAKASAAVKRKRSMSALKEIREFQRSTDLIIRKRAFQRIVKEIAQQIKPDVRMASAAVEAIQQATEAYMVDVFECTQLCALHARRITIKTADMRLALRMRGERWHPVGGK